MEFGLVIGLMAFFVGIFIGLPLWVVFLGCSTIAVVLMDGSLSFMAATAYHSMDSYVLMAVAFFIFAGNLMGDSGIADRLVRLANALVGHIKGGLIDVGIVATLFMSALTGSSVPCIAALIPLLVPSLEKYGYQRRYTAAVLCSSSFLGYLIPPSVPVLLYCLVAGQSVAAVFLSTVFPGLLLAFGYMFVNHLIARRYIVASTGSDAATILVKQDARERLSAFWYALPALGTPAIVLGGIYGGVFTPNEAGAFAVVYTFLIGAFIYKELTKRRVWDAMQATLRTLGMITLLLGFGVVFTRLMIREGVAQAFAQFVIGSVGDNKVLVLLMLNILLLILGMFIDGIPILLIAVPLVLPLVEAFDLNMVHLGAIVVLNVGLGVVTPPYAMSMFVGSRLAGVPYSSLIRPMMIFLFAVGLPTLFVTTYWPALSCWLPTLAVGAKIVGPW